MFKTKYLLGLIIILFLFTRLYKINEIPSAVYWDEASIGYNAYSVSLSGQDEWGEFLPIHFRAFGEFKLPVYIYAAVVSVKLFGLNEFAVRIPAVLFSLGVVIITYFLAKKLSGSINAGLFSSFFVVISPWFFIFSRTGYEVTAGLMFYLLAVYLFLKYSSNAWYLFFAVASFIFSAYSYNSFRIIAPLTILVLIFYSLNNLRNVFKKGMTFLIASFFILIVSTIPIYRLYTYDAGASRLQAIGATPANFMTNFLSHFDPDFLIWQGDKNFRSQQAGFGQLYLPELVLLILGLIYMIGRKPKNGALIIVLSLLGPIPAALTRESPHALRALSIVPYLSIISALGIDQLCRWIKRSGIVYITVIIIFLIFFANYFLNFLNVYPSESAKDWQDEYKKIFTGHKDSLDQYKKVVISDKYAQPYIFALFYLKYDPQKFRQEVVRSNAGDWGFSAVKEFGKFEFVKSQQLFSFEK